MDIAIIDTGIDLFNRDLTIEHADDCISHNGGCVTGFGAGDDDNGHGTAVAGIAD